MRAERTSERTCEACGHRFPQRWRGWNAVDVRYERCPRCGHENGYESDLYRWLRQRKGRRLEQDTV
jgi:DNA-directed RNA polymerase subunit RPC12/RpoP